jgi:O-methyltransferase
MNKNEFEILKRCLIGSLPFEYKEKFLSNKILQNELDSLLNNEIPNEKLYGKDWPKDAETMIGYERLTNLENCMIDVIKNNIEGDVIETGVWKGGACILMKYIIKKLNSNKKVFVADSFEGLPMPNPELYPKDTGDIHHEFNELKISLDEVKNNFKKYNILDDDVIFLKGWFKNTLPLIKEDQKFSLIRLDGDMYESTMDSLNNLYHKLSDGGYIIIDDFCLRPCVEATMDFRSKNNINNPILTVDFTGVYWKK